MSPQSGVAAIRNVIIQSITGNALPKYETYKKEQIGLQSRYAVCQPFIPEAVDDERRLMFVGGELVGWYGTVKNPNDHRANRLHGTTKVAVELSSDELKLAKNVGEGLKELGINYSAIDYAAGQVLEANMVTPGGIQLLAKIKGQEVIDQAARKLISVMSS